MIYLTAPFSMTWNDLYSGFKVAMLWPWISQKWYEIHSFNGILVGTYMCPTSVISNDPEWLSKIFNDLKSRMVSMRQLSFLLVNWTSCGCVASLCQIGCEHLHLVWRVTFYKIQYARHPPSWICWGSCGTICKGPVMVAIPCKNFVIISIAVLKL